MSYDQEKADMLSELSRHRKVLREFMKWCNVQWNLGPDKREIEDPLTTAAKLRELYKENGVVIDE